MIISRCMAIGRAFVAMRPSTCAAVCISGAFALQAAAQSLPAPSRTVFKCEVAGKVVYSDSPCLGARKLEVEPTRGANKITGKTRTGHDVNRELHREAIADAFRPLHGMDAKQLDVMTRRMKLSADGQIQCKRLDMQIPSAEADEAHSTGANLEGAQVRLLKLR